MVLIVLRANKLACFLLESICTNVTYGEDPTFKVGHLEVLRLPYLQILDLVVKVCRTQTV
jgi:hypothetical protein